MLPLRSIRCERKHVPHKTVVWAAGRCYNRPSMASGDPRRETATWSARAAAGSTPRAVTAPASATRLPWPAGQRGAARTTRCRLWPAALAIAAACAGPAVRPATGLAFQRREAEAATVVAPARGAGERSQPADGERGLLHEIAAQEASAPGSAVEPADAALAAPAPREREADLRRELATAVDPTAAALELAALLTQFERCAEALAAIDAARMRVPSPALRVARAGVLRDLGQRHLAVAELRALRRELGAAAMHPHLLFELAELEWLEGDGQGTQQTLRELATTHGDDEWTKTHRAAREELMTACQVAERPRRLAIRDLLGNLRGAPLATERLAVLEQLVRGAGLEPAARSELRGKAVAIALVDEAEAIRARAVQLAEVPLDDLAEFCQEALADASPMVRQFAMQRCRELPRELAIPLLLHHLAGESCWPVWQAARGTLQSWHPSLAPLSTQSVATAEDRQQVLAAWRAEVAS